MRLPYGVWVWRFMRCCAVVEILLAVGLIAHGEWAFAVVAAFFGVVLGLYPRAVRDAYGIGYLHGRMSGIAELKVDP